MEGSPPSGFIRFDQTVHGRSIAKRKAIYLVGIFLFSFGVVELVVSTLLGAVFALLFALFFVIFIYFVFFKDSSSLFSVPLAVNQFHPWADENPDGLNPLETSAKGEATVSEGISDAGLDATSGHSDNADSDNSDEPEENTMQLKAFGKPGEAEVVGPSEAVDRAEVMLWTPEKEWFNPGEVPVRIARNPLSTNWVLVAGDDDGTRWGEVVGVRINRMQWFSQLINLAMMQAQIVNGGTSVDAFGDARGREESDSSLLEREWEKTTPGMLSQDDLLSGGLREALRTRSKARDVDVTPLSDPED
jgi:hypothetical protein